MDISTGGFRSQGNNLKPGVGYESIIMVLSILFARGRQSDVISAIFTFRGKPISIQDKFNNSRYLNILCST